MAQYQSFSEKMRKLRAIKKMSLQKLSKETGYSEKYLEQIENNEQLASVSVIFSVSKALQTASEDLLDSKTAEPRKKTRKQREVGFQKRADNYSYEVLTPQGKYKHLNAFKVIIKPQQDHKMAQYHHQGEEFIFVLSGILKLKVGKSIHILKPNESIHFDSTRMHKLWSVSEEPTILIVATYSP